jgi:hypothetical protein
VRREARPQPPDVDAARGEGVELLDQRRRVDHDAGPDDRDDVRIEDARRDEMELEDLVAEHQRVSGVVAALVTDDDRGLLGEEVGRLALALVAPLEPDDHGCGHQSASDMTRPRAGPGSGIHISRESSPACWRSGASKVLIRLTERMTRLPRATAVSLTCTRGREDRASIARGDRPRGSDRSIRGRIAHDSPVRDACRGRARGTFGQPVAGPSAGPPRPARPLAFHS